MEQLLALGAWRTLRNAKGERPVDIARRCGHTRLISILEPILRHSVRPDALRQLQEHFHSVIRGWAADLVREHALRLPELELLLELAVPKLWFPIPGMYGGFSVRLDHLLESHVLVTESWCRVVDGSGERHIISPHGSLLIAEGFI
ncbi:MAG: hypothetical protein M3Q65_00300 [Chloroflexota bacterium]|nr:hypothetical protein [Chloroflexota bacterium]